jgi:hypothetical protein
MAEKRMFTMKIIDSDDFLEMPMSTQALYFHLNMRADDDGFINNPKRIMRTVNASEDDMKILITKRFVLAFESGVIVIKHWRMHNAIRKDRYHPTQYTEELESLEVKKNGAYTEHGNHLTTNWQPDGNQLATTCQPSDSQSVSESSIDKSRVGKSINNNTPSNIPQEFDLLWDMYPKYKKQGKKKAIEAYRRARKAGTSFEEVRSGLESYVRYIEAEHIEDRFIKQGGTFFTQNAWDGDWVSRRMESDDLDGIL